jgi:hypothetical protein
MAFGILPTEVPQMASPWDKSRVEHWAQGFAALAKFRAHEGHCCPPQRYIEDNFKLGQWLSVQRYRKDFLPEEHKRFLDAIRFVWDPRRKVWEQNFAALLKFKQREGHCCVPTDHRENGLKLGWWVATQRRKKRKISKERQTRLNEVGFVWRALTGSVAYRAKAPRHTPKEKFHAFHAEP